MSDVTVAPDGGGAPSAAPEAVINQAPINQPSPIGSQAPDKPVGDIEGSSHRPESRREAIKAAFDRASDPNWKPEKPKAAPKPAEAKMGHNQPPEETEKLDLKKRPADQPRSERGQFAPRAADNGVNPQNAQRAAQDANTRQQTAQTAQRAAPQLPANAPFRDPPQRMAATAKHDWASTPETVRGDIHRMHQEFGAAYQQYRGDHETMNQIRPFHDLAVKHGTTLQRALTNYVTMETKLRADPIGGLDIIVNNLHLQHNGQPIGLRDIAYAILNQTPDQQKILQNQNAQAAAQHQIGTLHQEIKSLKETIYQMLNQQQHAYTRSAVDQFADNHPRFDELGTEIEAELKNGYDLPTAYRRAELLRPTAHAAQTRTTSAQTRPADRSIRGAPDVSASNAASRRPEKTPDRRDAIQHAMRSVGGAL
jgi:hypothetical protein